MPTPWQYEWIEAFLHVLGREEMVFADHEEGHRKKQGYSPVGGCYYSCRMAVLDALAKEGKQAGAIILREARRGYIPLGVFNVRENVKHAMGSSPREFNGLPEALDYLYDLFFAPACKVLRRKYPSVRPEKRVPGKPVGILSLKSLVVNSLDF